RISLLKVHSEVRTGPTSFHSLFPSRKFEMRNSKSKLDSPNHFVRPPQHAWRNRQTDLLRRLEIDRQLEFRWLLHRQLGRFRSFQDLVDVICYAPITFRDVRPVVHEPGIYIFPVNKRCRKASMKSAMPEAVLASRKPMRWFFPVCCASLLALHT